MLGISPAHTAVAVRLICRVPPSHTLQSHCRVQPGRDCRVRPGRAPQPLWERDGGGGGMVAYPL